MSSSIIGIIIPLLAFIIILAAIVANKEANEKRSKENRIDQNQDKIDQNNINIKIGVIRCTKCGNHVDPSANYCDLCGANLN